MKSRELEEKLGYECLSEGNLHADIVDGYTSDLLSDVMGNAPDRAVLITIQAHKNSVAVASLAGITAIVLCNGRKAPEEMLEAAINEEIAIFRTGDNQFTASWKIAGLLHIPS